MLAPVAVWLQYLFWWVFLEPSWSRRSSSRTYSGMAIAKVVRSVDVVLVVVVVVAAANCFHIFRILVTCS